MALHSKDNKDNSKPFRPNTQFNFKDSNDFNFASTFDLFSSLPVRYSYVTFCCINCHNKCFTIKKSIHSLQKNQTKSPPCQPNYVDPSLEDV